ncbi:hypothetical protein [Fusibacillus kribbianus]|uniref:Ribbon-helix-helix protein CopG domain-containing protein n=1 Tax=Fusibacillus kribbianus TaxID=3044208 RepID=A0AAP4BCQ3_9FIRM|nr:hypothetical protein [Ruminococcus sp. YH-rum2234]MDI9241924.1 hypothetical protein [Ruminococcus sp. YH-rum2234]
MARTPRIPVALKPESYEKLKLYAHKEGRSMSEVAAEYIEAGLKGEVGLDNIDLITKIIREQLNNVIEPYIDRLAALSAKGALYGATSMLLNAETISRFVDVDQQMDIQEAYNKAKARAVEITKIKIEKDWTEDV